jgi:NADH-quinone oxidoreductase subunit L
LRSFAICGIYPLAGFFSKDEILYASFQRSIVLWGVGAITAGITAFYMTRLYILVFRGEERFDHEVSHHVHESPRTMVVPLAILAVLSFAGGWIGMPRVISAGIPNLLEGWLEPVFGGHAAAAGHGAGLELGLMAVSFLIAIFGMFLGWVFYERRPELPEQLAESARGAYRLVANKYFIDELYDKVVLAPYYGLCRASAWFDKTIVDGLVNAAGYVTLGGSYVSVGFDTYIVDGLVNATGYIVRFFSWMFRKLQTGIVQSYATAMILGIFILVSVYLLSMRP